MSSAHKTWTSKQGFDWSTDLFAKRPYLVEFTALPQQNKQFLVEVNFFCWVRQVGRRWLNWVAQKTGNTLQHEIEIFLPVNSAEVIDEIVVLVSRIICFRWLALFVEAHNQNLKLDFSFYVIRENYISLLKPSHPEPLIICRHDWLKFAKEPTWSAISTSGSLESLNNR